MGVPSTAASGSTTSTPPSMLGSLLTRPLPPHLSNPTSLPSPLFSSTASSFPSDCSSRYSTPPPIKFVSQPVTHVGGTHISASCPISPAVPLLPSSSRSSKIDQQCNPTHTGNSSSVHRPGSLLVYPSPLTPLDLPRFTSESSPVSPLASNNGRSTYSAALNTFPVVSAPFFPVFPLSSPAVPHPARDTQPSLFRANVVPSRNPAPSVSPFGGGSVHPTSREPWPPYANMLPKSSGRPLPPGVIHQLHHHQSASYTVPPNPFLLAPGHFPPHTRYVASPHPPPARPPLTPTTTYPCYPAAPHRVLQQPLDEIARTTSNGPTVVPHRSSFPIYPPHLLSQSVSSQCLPIPARPLVQSSQKLEASPKSPTPNTPDSPCAFDIYPHKLHPGSPQLQTSCVAQDSSTAFSYQPPPSPRPPSDANVTFKASFMQKIPSPTDKDPICGIQSCAMTTPPSATSTADVTPTPSTMNAVSSPLSPAPHNLESSSCELSQNSAADASSPVDISSGTPDHNTGPEFICNASGPLPCTSVGSSVIDHSSGADENQSGSLSPKQRTLDRISEALELLNHEDTRELVTALLGRKSSQQLNGSPQLLSSCSPHASPPVSASSSSPKCCNQREVCLTSSPHLSHSSPEAFKELLAETTNRGDHQCDVYGEGNRDDVPNEPDASPVPRNNDICFLDPPTRPLSAGVTSGGISVGPSSPGSCFSMGRRWNGELRLSHLMGPVSEIHCDEAMPVRLELHCGDGTRRVFVAQETNNDEEDSQGRNEDSLPYRRKNCNGKRPPRTISSQMSTGCECVLSEHTDKVEPVHSIGENFTLQKKTSPTVSRSLFKRIPRLLLDDKSSCVSSVPFVSRCDLQLSELSGSRVGHEEFISLCMLGVTSATRIQRWYRHRRLRRVLKIRLRKIGRFLKAVVKLQRWWRGRYSTMRRKTKVNQSFCGRGHDPRCWLESRDHRRLTRCSSALKTDISNSLSKSAGRTDPSSDAGARDSGAGDGCSMFAKTEECSVTERKTRNSMRGTTNNSNVEYTLTVEHTIGRSSFGNAHDALLTGRRATLSSSSSGVDERPLQVSASSWDQTEVTMVPQDRGTPSRLVRHRHSVSASTLPCVRKQSPSIGSFKSPSGWMVNQEERTRRKSLGACWSYVDSDEKRNHTNKAGFNGFKKNNEVDMVPTVCHSSDGIGYAKAFSSEVRGEEADASVRSRLTEEAEGAASKRVVYRKDGCIEVDEEKRTAGERRGRDGAIVMSQDMQILPVVAKRLVLKGALSMELSDCEVEDMDSSLLGDSYGQGMLDDAKDDGVSKQKGAKNYLRRKSVSALGQPAIKVDFSTVKSKIGGTCRNEGSNSHKTGRGNVLSANVCNNGSPLLPNSTASSRSKKTHTRVCTANNAPSVFAHKTLNPMKNVDPHTKMDASKSRFVCSLKQHDSSRGDTECSSGGTVEDLSVGLESGTTGGSGGGGKSNVLERRKREEEAGHRGITGHATRGTESAEPALGDSLSHDPCDRSSTVSDCTVDNALRRPHSSGKLTRANDGFTRNTLGSIGSVAVLAAAANVQRQVSAIPSLSMNSIVNKKTCFSCTSSCCAVSSSTKISCSSTASTSNLAMSSFASVLSSSNLLSSSLLSLPSLPASRLPKLNLVLPEKASAAVTTREEAPTHAEKLVSEVPRQTIASGEKPQTAGRNDDSVGECVNLGSLDGLKAHVTSDAELKRSHVEETDHFREAPILSEDATLSGKIKTIEVIEPKTPEQPEHKNEKPSTDLVDAYWCARQAAPSLDRVSASTASCISLDVFDTSVSVTACGEAQNGVSGGILEHDELPTEIVCGIAAVRDEGAAKEGRQGADIRDEGERDYCNSLTQLSGGNDESDKKEAE
eukprot:GHVQ01026048.1.p1 GENE.GHVQ01026048.1~~GHVQ01026048.1.p1  ORF type:complete len:1860 (-),score=283.86 GHVQ01026048.1:808-6387(-)